MKRLCSSLFLYLLLTGIAYSQIAVTSVQNIPIPKSEHWSNARFSPDGQSIYLTNTELNGIWEYSLPNRLLRQITNDRQSGFGFILSSDGSSIAYRNTIQEWNGKEARLQQSVIVDLKTLGKRILEQGNAVDLPFFTGTNHAVSKAMLTAEAQRSSAKTQVIGTDNSGILLLKNGSVISIDPFAGGQYIWPALSPDGTKLTGVEMSRGAFICDADGKNVKRIGKCNSPQWSPDGKWVIGMNDTDDGHVIVGSELVAVSADGSKRIELTNSKDVIELFPAVHPFNNEIIVTTSAGGLLLLKFTEGK